MVCPTLVDVAGRCSTHVRVMNPFPDPRVIPGNVVLGTLEQVQQGRVIKDEEFPGAMKPADHGEQPRMRGTKIYDSVRMKRGPGVAQA